MGAALRAMRWKVMGSLPITRFPPNGTLEAPLPPCGASYLLDVPKPRASLAEDLSRVLYVFDPAVSLDVP